MKLGWYIVPFILLCVFVAGLSNKSTPRETRRPPTVNKVESHTYRLGEREHMLLIDIPDKYVPRRCMVYVNELINSSHLNCNFDAAGAPFPQAAEE